ncbi:cytochrome b/b6 domain-containing protein [Tellurirhabdus rosea]|uniref:cytochrome b/b6 domain-containing protein n=1 Tax=Tellurirhabdus rosea TaxID=2674997 RepID=UPI002251ED6A|nr:cytochrome b/b6 domain-containing protein [Tellurirhabdus rosea]
MKRILENKHPLAIRWFHWVNFPVLAVMIWSGLLIYWAYPAYRIQVGDTVLAKFFPNWFFNALKLRRRLAEGMAWHFVFMWLFTVNGLLYVAYTAFSGEWRHLLPNRHSFREAWLVLLHDLGIRKSAPVSDKYNAAQKIAYTAIVLMGIGSALTGFAIYKPTQFAGLTALLGGYKTARLLHFALTIGYVLFFVVHILQVIRAGWNNFQSMVTGFDVVRENEQPVISTTDRNPTV